MNKNIIVTGGAGYVGSHVCKCLSNKGYDPIVLDNLSRGNKWAVKWGDLLQGDMLDFDFLNVALKKVKPFAVIHLAAFADIGESNLKALMYYENNISATINLLKAMKINKLSNLIFSSSCSTFGKVKESFVDEKAKMNPLSPYAFSKMVCEEMIINHKKNNSFEYIILRYFNAAGADLDNIIGESNNSHKRIIPQIIKAIISGHTLEVFGDDYDTFDGTCIRDYVHVNDIAKAHLLALEYLTKNRESHDINIGSGVGYSILEIIKKLELILNKKVDTSFSPRRLGDASRLVASIKKAKEILNWKPSSSDLEIILKSAIKWEKKR